MDFLNHQFMELIKGYWPDTDYDSVLLFFRAFDPDKTLTPNNEKLEKIIESNNDKIMKDKNNNDDDDDEEDEENEDNDKLSISNKEEKKKLMAYKDPLKYLGSYMFDKLSKLPDLFKAADDLIQNYYNDQNLLMDEGTFSTGSSRNVPDIWKDSLYYTLSRTLVDVNEDMNSDDDRLRAQPVINVANSVRYN